MGGKRRKPRFEWTLPSLTAYIKKKLGIGGKSKRIRQRKLQVSREIDALHGSTVAYGPFKGLTFAPDSWWSAPDRAGMILGLYEQEILEALNSVPEHYRTFIDLGAADGYYGVGVLLNGRFDRSYCFEIGEKGQQVIRQTAELNGVSERITVYGMADKSFHKRIAPENIAASVMLVDIEGGEFELLDRYVLEAFRRSILFIEIHEDKYLTPAENQARLDHLKADASEFFTITEYRTGARDPSRFAELRRYSDADRWLICSEGRGILGLWLKLVPRSG